VAAGAGSSPSIRKIPVVCRRFAKSLALQAADLLAWATNRILSKAPDEPAPGTHLEPIMKQIIPSSWILWDENRFRETDPAG
jgi:hypothetical protein